MHELRADLEAYTKEDMQNNKFIFLEQQKIAIKLSKALDFSTEQFMKYIVDRNEGLRSAKERARHSGVAIKSVLPEPTYIYHKDFHFLDEPLIERQKKREAVNAAKAAAAQKQASQNESITNEVDSASTQATTTSAGPSAASSTTTQKTAAPPGVTVAKLSSKQHKSDS